MFLLLLLMFWFFDFLGMTCETHAFAFSNFFWALFSCLNHAFFKLISCYSGPDHVFSMNQSVLCAVTSLSTEAGLAVTANMQEWQILSRVATLY